MRFVLLIFLFFITSCDYTSMNLSQSSVDAPQSPDEICASDTAPVVASNAIDYQKVKVEVFEAHCVRCHNPGRPSAGIDLTSFANIKARLTQIDMAVTRNIMPPSGPLDPVKKGMLSDWIKAGAPNSQSASVPCAPTTPSVGDQTDSEPPPVVAVEQPLTSMPSDSEINFTLIKNKIFSFYCLSCHSDAGGNRDGVNLERYRNVIDDLKDLQEVLSEGSMPPRPRPGLSLLEKNVILRWIRLGAPQ